MRLDEVRRCMDGKLSDLEGWDPDPSRPGHFRHIQTGVHVIVYRTEIMVLFGPAAAAPAAEVDFVVSTSTRYSPEKAINSIIEVARALVAQRLTPENLAEPGEV